MKIDLNGKTKNSKFKNFVKRIVSFADSILFPSNIKCIDCGKDLPGKQEIELCDDCLGKLEFLDEEKCCKLCGSKLKSSNLCLNCKSHKREFDIARSVASYEGDVAKIVVNFKYNNKPYFSRTLGALLAKRFEELNWKVDFAIFVPVTKRRMKTRGYNQAQLLANELSKRTKIPVLDNVLIKKKDTQQQAGLGFKDRQENIKKTFAVLDKDKLNGKTVVLVDDVFTTGATSNACAKCLKDAGVKMVYVLTFASTPSKILTTNAQETN